MKRSCSCLVFYDGCRIPYLVLAFPWPEEISFRPIFLLWAQSYACISCLLAGPGHLLDLASRDAVYNIDVIKVDFQDDP